MRIGFSGMSPPDIKIFADGADYDGIVEMSRNPLIKGFTTNPTLMRKAGVDNYENFARKVLSAIPELPVSFEVFADDCYGMVEQGLKISSWGKNVYVKVPVTYTDGRSTTDVVHALSSSGIRLNVTAIFTLQQVFEVAVALDPKTPAIVSVFAGRIADTGVDPVGRMCACKSAISGLARVELLWASTREIINIAQAQKSYCDIITVPNDMIGKLDLLGKDLSQYSLETVRSFHRDAQAAGYQI